MKRTVTRRIIDASGSEIETTSHTIDLALVAHSAAIETLQIDLVARGWVGLFSALLEPGLDSSPLVWLAGGPGGEAEVKRAYSALFGRFFGRAVLRHEHGCYGLRQVRPGMTLALGIELHRKPTHLTGDLPDWVGWNRAHRCWTICEAKGSYEKASWSARRPPIVDAASEQLARVHILQSGALLQTKDWVVASRWGTAENRRDTTIITKDPLTDGRALSSDEAETVSREVSARWLADLLKGIGRSFLANRLLGKDDSEDVNEYLEISTIGGRDIYAALLIDGHGVIPLRGPARDQRLHLARGIAEDLGSKIAVVGIDANAVSSAIKRDWVPDEEALTEKDGVTVMADGVLFTWNVDGLRL